MGPRGDRRDPGVDSRRHVRLAGTQDGGARSPLLCGWKRLVFQEYTAWWVAAHTSWLLTARARGCPRPRESPFLLTPVQHTFSGPRLCGSVTQSQGGGLRVSVMNKCPGSPSCPGEAAASPGQALLPTWSPGLHISSLGAGKAGGPADPGRAGARPERFPAASSLAQSALPHREASPERSRRAPGSPGEQSGPRALLAAACARRGRASRLWASACPATAGKAAGFCQLFGVTRLCWSGPALATAGWLSGRQGIYFKSWNRIVGREGKPGAS